MPASSRLYAAIVEQRIVLPDNDELRRHAAAAIARRRRRGRRIDTANRADDIDAVIALGVAVEAVENRPEPRRLLA